MGATPAPVLHAVVGHAPIRARQAKQTLNRAQALRRSQVEQALDAQAERDGCAGEEPLASSLAAGDAAQLALPGSVMYEAARPGSMLCATKPRR